MNSRGGAALDKCKLADGTWNLDSIIDGHHDREAKRQNHTTKMYYPEQEWKALEPLERRKVFLNRMGKGGGGGNAGQTQPVPADVSLSSVSNASTISTLESSVSKLSKTVKALVDGHNDKMREISNLKRAADKAGLYEGLSESDASDIFGESSYDSNDMRARLKSDNKSQRDHPALGRQGGRARRGDR